MTNTESRTHSITVLGEYLWARRSIIQPEAVGLQREANRRVPGLRREEVAKLASISPDYYLRLEQGHDREPSDQVLRGIARALLLDKSAEQHLLRLRRLQPHQLSNAGYSQDEFTPGDGLLSLLKGWADTPALIISSNFDVLLVNEVGVTVGDGRLQSGLNLVEAAFSAQAREEEGWMARAERSLAALRYHGNPYDRRFQQVVGRLSIRDDDFRRLWALHNARPIPHGQVQIDVSSSEKSVATFNAFDVPGSDGLMVIVLTESNL